MKKILGYVVTTSLLLTPGLALAVYNDVSVGTNAVISVGGASLNVAGTGGVVQSIVVNGSSFDVTLLAGSSFDVKSPDKKVFNFTNPLQIVNTYTCGSSASELNISSVPSTVTVTITLGGPCSSAVASSGGGGNGAPLGGGGGGSYFPSTPSISASTSSSSNTAPSPVSAAGGVTFSGEFGAGAKGADVIKLQTFLEGKGFLVMPKGVTKGLFGALTKKALKAYQKSKGILQTGYLGLKTRAAIAAEQ